MKPSVNHVLDERRAKKDGRYPVKIRIIHNRIPRDFKTGVSLTKAEYGQAWGARPPKNLVEETTTVDAWLGKARAIVDKMPVFGWEPFTSQYYGQMRSAHDIFPFFAQQIKTLREQERINTADSYQWAAQALAQFQSKIGFGDITPAFLSGFQTWMVAKGRSLTTVGIYVRNLRAIYNAAIADGVIEKTSAYPFTNRKYAIPAGRNVKKALQLEDVEKILDFEPRTLSEERARDFWVFSYLCGGINFKDICLLKNSDVDGDMLRYVREKTRRSTQTNALPISVHLAARTLSIIAKWRNEDRSPGAYLFPVFSAADDAPARKQKLHQFIKTTNKYVRRIGDAVGIGADITTYVGRHTAATVLKRAGVSVNRIQEMLGHTSERTTNAYLGSFDDDSKRQLSAHLQPK